MGEINKLLVEVDGVAMVVRVLDALTTARERRLLTQIVVVTGHEQTRIRDALAGRQAIFVHNPSYVDGMSSSLRVGVSALPTDIDAALICLADMPWTHPDHIRRIVEAFDPSRGHEIVIPCYRETRGHPVLFSRRLFPDLFTIRGDVGARQVVRKHADVVFQVPIADAAVVTDVDTLAALETLRE